MPGRRGQQSESVLSTNPARVADPGTSFFTVPISFAARLTFGLLRLFRVREALARAWANHVRYEQLSHVSRTLGVNPRPTFISVEPEPLPGPMSPDADDLRLLPLLCCGDEVKALWDWEGPLHCPRCGTRHGGLSGRQQIELQLVEE